jgi:uncharacterized delta-60 repeat protein
VLASVVRIVRVLVSILVLFAVLLAPGSALAAAGDLDPSFSGDGIVTSTNDYQGGGQGPVAIDSRGRIVVASDTSIERYMPNGTLDQSFGRYGQTGSPFGGTMRSMAIDSQDRIVVAGNVPNPADPHQHQVFAVGRLTTAGTPDPSFSGDGYVLTPIGGTANDEAHAVTVDPAGRIVAAGLTHKRNPDRAFFALARYMPNGSPDTSFSGDGQLQTEFPNVTYAYGYEVALDSKARLVVVGLADSRFAVARYGPRGGLDPSFSGDGMLTTAMGAKGSSADAVAIDDSDRIVVGGLAAPVDPSKYDLALARYRPTGALDRSFSGDGKVLTSFGRERNGASGLAIDDQGRIVAAGWTLDMDNSRSAFALARYTPAGALDPTFSGDGRVTTSIGGFSGAGGVTLDPFGRIVVGGSTSKASLGDPRIVVARYLGG